MSFSSIVKNELSRIELENTCCKLAEAAGAIRTTAHARKDGSVVFTTENSAVARRMFKLLKELYTEVVKVTYMSSYKFKRHTNYTVTLPADIVAALYRNRNDLYSTSGHICCARAYLRGVFLASGSVSDPEKSYHLELTIKNQDAIDEVVKCFNVFELTPHIIQRKNNYVLYIKEAEQIVDFLNIIQAHNALLKYEDVRVLKSVRNDINRLVNCETANLGKTVNASVKQVEYIKMVEQSVGIDSLPKSLREIARLRLDNPDASLKELGEMTNPPIGKSGVNHRLKKIKEIVEGGDGK
jgi:DNA-binding protein WhiA